MAPFFLTNSFRSGQAQRNIRIRRKRVHRSQAIPVGFRVASTPFRNVNSVGFRISGHPLNRHLTTRSFRLIIRAITIIRSSRLHRVNRSNALRTALMKIILLGRSLYPNKVSQQLMAGVRRYRRGTSCRKGSGPVPVGSSHVRGVSRVGFKISLLRVVQYLGVLYCRVGHFKHGGGGVLLLPRKGERGEGERVRMFIFFWCLFGVVYGRCLISLALHWDTGDDVRSRWGRREVQSCRGRVHRRGGGR